MSDMKKVAAPLEKQSKGPARPYGVNGFLMNAQIYFNINYNYQKKQKDI